MRRILFVHHCSDLGGLSLCLLALVDQLDRRQFAPSILFNAPPGTATKPFEERGIPTYYEPEISIYPHAQGALLQLRSLRPWEIVTKALAIRPSAHRFARFLGSHPHDLVHLNSSVQVPAAIGAHWSGTPVVWHIHEELHPGFLGVRRRLIRGAIDKYADAVIAISERSASLLRQSPRVQVVYNLMEWDRFDQGLTKTGAREALGLPTDRPIVLMLGGIVAHKGAVVLVTAAAHVRSVEPRALFVIAGLPPTGAVSSSRTRRLARRVLEAVGLVENVERGIAGRLRDLGDSDTVRFVGMRGDVPALLAACDLLVWPATVSHFARPVIEAGFMSRPIVASDFPGSREIVRQGESGLLVPPGRPQALAAAILELIRDPSAAARMGEAGWRMAQGRYDGRSNAAMIEHIYEQVLERHASRSR